MFPFEDFKYFLCVVDIFSRKIFVSNLKTKEAGEIRLAFEKIFKEAGGVCQKLETDQGTKLFSCVE